MKAAALLLCAALAAPLPGAASEVAAPAGLQLPGARLAGEGELRWWGLRLYRAQLWTGPGFEAQRFARHPFALELHYLRDFRARDIAQRSIEEMRRAGDLADADARRWERALAQLLPDVRAGDRIMGVHQPGGGAAFVVNGRPVGGIDEPAFAQRFFAIWLGPATSEPGLRAALLGNASP